MFNWADNRGSRRKKANRVKDKKRKRVLSSWGSCDPLFWQVATRDLKEARRKEQKWRLEKEIEIDSKTLEDKVYTNQSEIISHILTLKIFSAHIQYCGYKHELKCCATY